MAETTTRVSLKDERNVGETAFAPQAWRSFKGFRQEMDRLFEDFERGWPWRHSMFSVEPFWRQEATRSAAPAVDVAETDKVYELTAELPGLTEKDIEVKLINDELTVRGEKQEEKEEKEKDYYISERRYGKFERSFRLPEGVDSDKIEASFQNGVLKVTLPKTLEAKKVEKKINVRAG
jgi:HSP20 family protein